MPPAFHTVLFDWDGTLCDSGAALYRAFQKSLADFDIAFTLAEYTAVYTPAWYRMYEAFTLPKESWNACDLRWLHHFQGEQPDLLPGAASVLDHCSTAGLQVGIVTGANRDRIRDEFARHGLAFPAVVCHEDVVQRKPHPEGIRRALAQLNADAAGCCFVGDAPEDIQMGKSAGIFTIGVFSDYVDRARLRAAAPDLLIETIGNLPDILGPTAS
ncbi:MAG: HAD-superfamily hydrolase, subfamily variant 1 [Candidatus Solibacter sp.]|nr:HAD-superfamily hydrolase, subfamily variant 1 [Candidatus Solibacter sp.]